MSVSEGQPLTPEQEADVRRSVAMFEDTDEAWRLVGAVLAELAREREATDRDKAEWERERDGLLSALRKIATAEIPEHGRRSAWPVFAEELQQVASEALVGLPEQQQDV